MLLEAFQRLGLALAIGLLIGVERGWRAREMAEGGRTAGLRTFALTGLLGGVTGMLAPWFGGWVIAAVGVPLMTAFILFKMREQAEEHDHSVTTIVAALLVYALGVFAVLGDGRLAAAAAVTMAALLAFKDPLHLWLRALTWAELRAALVLLAMSFIALPVLPNRGFGPYGAVNPYDLWLLTIVLAGVSFLAYAAIRIFGRADGVMLASLAGALVSSTAVTVFVAREDRRAASPLSHAGAALLAGTVMALRIGAISATMFPPLFLRLAWPIGVFAGLSAVFGVAGWWFGGRSRDGGAPPMKSPFDLGSVAKLALALGAVMALAKILTVLYGAGGLLTVAAVAGLADVDALTLTASRMATQGLGVTLAAGAILLAAGTDSLSKIALAAILGGRRFALLFAGGTLVAAAGAGAALWMTAGA